MSVKGKKLKNIKDQRKDYKKTLMIQLQEQNEEKVKSGCEKSDQDESHPSSCSICTFNSKLSDTDAQVDEYLKEMDQKYVI